MATAVRDTLRTKFPRLSDRAPFRGALKAASGRAQPSHVHAAPMLDCAILDELRDLLGAARLCQLLDLLAIELEERPRVIRGCVADRDFSAAAAQAHSLMSATANLGASAVSAAAATLQRAIAAAADGDPRLIAPSLRRLADTASETQRALVDLHRQATLEIVCA